MGTKLTKEAARSETLEWLVGEAVESSEPLEKLQRKLLSLKRGSEAYSDTLAEIAVAAEVLKAKLSSLVSGIDAAEDNMSSEE